MKINEHSVVSDNLCIDDANRTSTRLPNNLVGRKIPHFRKLTQKGEKT